MHSSAMRAFNSVIAGTSRLIDLVAPRTCAACDVPIGHAGRSLCSTCWAEISVNVAMDYCQTCGEEPGPHLLREGRCTACRESHSGHVKFHRFIRVGRYDRVFKALILRFKYQYTYDELLGGMLSAAIARSDAAAGVDHWIPIPSHWRRKLTRGFQPTLLLARRALTGIKRVPVEGLIATRIVEQFHSRPHVSRTKRMKEVEGAFEVARGIDLKGKAVGLIDDVCTTGATLAEAARTLRHAGAGRIVAAVLARTGHRDDAPIGVDPHSASA